MELVIEENSFTNINVEELLSDDNYKKSILIPSDISFILSDKITFADLSKLNRKGINILFKDMNNSAKNFSESLELKESVSSNNIDTKSNMVEFSEYFIEQIMKTSFDNIIETVITNNVSAITRSNIPQFSNFDDGTNRLITTIRKAGDYGPGFDDLGLYLTISGKKAAAYKKYGENHSKLASLFDIVYIVRKNGANKVYLTELGKAMEKMSSERSKNLLAKLAVKIPVIKSLIIDSMEGNGNIKEILSLYISESTIQRRRPNVKYLINLIRDEYEGVKYKNVLDNII